ncbi:uncharacterized protein BDV14DRAFT_205535 [Aspergillus stella-maris]|uniref:uncharacterized protein n=1 Tax=Aspergillus stella-maris TaxID=1810926 RepID=UPI003CCD7EC3
MSQLNPSNRPSTSANEPIFREEVDNPEVASAPKTSVWGMHVGPIYANASTNIADPHPADVPNPNGGAPTPGLRRLSGSHGGICWVSIGGEQMCGTPYSVSGGLYRHIRAQHPVAMNILFPPRSNTPVLEKTAGENALKRMVISGEWRRARFGYEPGRGPLNGIIDRFATGCEVLAQHDPDFARKFGTRFHRNVVNPIISSPRGLRNIGAAPPPAPGVPSPAETRAYRAAVGAPGANASRLQLYRAANACDERETTPDVADDEEEEDDHYTEGTPSKRHRKK